MFLIEQGVRIAHARPYHPQTMGKDERFHRSLKAEVLAGRTFNDVAAAAAALGRWRGVYNSERPHEALGLATPVERYRPSPRNYQERVAPFEYAPTDAVRRVQHGGHVSLAGRTFRVPKAFRGQSIALRPTAEDGVYQAFFRHQRIATIDLQCSNRLRNCNPCPRTGVTHLSGLDTHRGEGDRARLRPARSVAKPRRTRRLEPCQPFVPGLRTDADPATRLAHRHTARSGQPHELAANVNHRLGLPRHRRPPKISC